MAVQTPVSPDDRAYRVAVSRQLRELLARQRERFLCYLDSLKKQRVAIESGNTDALLARLELEEHIVTDIFSIQRVIDPLENIYNAAIPVSGDVSALKASLDDLWNQAVQQSARNRELLSVRMADIRVAIAGLRNNPFTNASRSRHHHSGAASLIDIKG